MPALRVFGAVTAVLLFAFVAIDTGISSAATIRSTAPRSDFPVLLDWSAGGAQGVPGLLAPSPITRRASRSSRDRMPPTVDLRLRNADTILKDHALVIDISCNEACHGTLHAGFGPRLGDLAVAPIVRAVLRLPRGKGRRTLRLKLTRRVSSAIRKRITPLYLAQLDLTANARDDRGNLAHTSTSTYIKLHPDCDSLAGVIAGSELVRLAIVEYDPPFSYAIVCERGSRVLHAILNDVLDPPFLTATSGAIVAMATTTPPDGNQVGFVYDVSAGARLRDFASSTDFLQALVVTPDGASADIQVKRFEGATTVEADDASGHRVLDSGPGIDRHSLQIDDHTVTWRNAGQLRSAVLDAGL